jgi:hypothetical protein
MPQLSASSASTNLDACAVSLTSPTTANGFSLHGRSLGNSRYLVEGTSAANRPWRSQALDLRSAEVGKLPGPHGPDYLFALEEHESSIDGEDGVPLHRSDSFMVLQPGAKGTRTAAYHWNGFGFSGIDDVSILTRCRTALRTSETQSSNRRVSQ